MTKKEQTARKYFGVTEDTSLAGFILTNGEMLNISEGGFQRDYDHIEIGYLLMGDEDEGRPEADNFAIDELFSFIAEGPIRCSENWLEIIRFPTPEQNAAIANFCETFYGFMGVWIADENGEVLVKKEFVRGTDGWEIVDWIRSEMSSVTAA